MHLFDLWRVRRVLRMALSVATLTRVDRFLEVLDRLLLAIEAGALLVMEPAQLLQDFGVVGIALEHARICGFGRVVLSRCQSGSCNVAGVRLTSFCCSCTWPIWNQMSSSLRGRGGSATM